MSPTFREIESAKGVAPSEVGECSPLGEWYARVRDVPLAAFGVEDLCKSVRQCLYLEHVVPAALDLLEKEPLSGEMYDGELASAFHAIPDTFWRADKHIAARARSILQSAFPQFNDDGSRIAVSAVLARIQTVTGRS
jgi:hypothetical protein